MSADPRDRTCEACERDDALDPHENAARLDAIAYRIGDHGRFLARMRGWISRQVVPPNDREAQARPLEALSTRADDDPMIALMDAWACTLDVLTFYQERIANEGFLRTARERRSVLELARAIGYELAPGIAASTRLAFTLLATKKAPDEVTLSTGLQVMSVPGPGELPQSFETVEDVLARPQWNAMRPLQREPQDLVRGGDELYLDGLSTGLRVGSKLLIVGQERVDEPASNVWDFRTVVGIELDKQAVVTRVRLDTGMGWSGFGGTRTIDPPAEPRVFAFARRLDVFGRSAPDPRMFARSMKDSLGALLDGDEWADFRATEAAGGVRVHLVGAEDVTPGSWLVFEDEDYVELYNAKVVEASGRTDFSLSLETTRITLDTNVNLDRFEPRTATVHGVSREIPLGTRAVVGAVEGDEIVLEGELPLLEPGRAVIVSGPADGTDPTLGRDDPEIVLLAEVALVAAMEHAGGNTLLRLQASLASRYDRTRTVVYGNVARATHGKTVTNEVLGSGDGSRRFQSFTLRQSPVTHVASTAGGVSSSLTVRVGGVAWAPVTSTYGVGPDARVYVPRIGNDGQTTILFGDGRNGARLPTGSENVTASYRAGLGRSGAVAADALTILKTRPQGVKAVTNPLAATGSQDPETLADARAHAPTNVLTLGRLVSVSDYEDFARAYPGIGKAQAVRLWDGRRRWVHLSLATSEGAPLAPTDDLYASLTGDIDARRDPVQRILVGTFVRRTFKLRASLRLDPAHVAEDVLEAVRAALHAAFSFHERSFGQAVTGAEILAIAHRVPGVIAVDLDALWRANEDEPPADATTPSAWVLPALPTRWDANAGAVAPTELLLLDEGEDAVTLEEASP